jgi:hypothetical protein
VLEEVGTEGLVQSSIKGKQINAVKDITTALTSILLLP